MQRQRHSQPRRWLYIGVSFLAGAIITLILISGKRETGVSWQDLKKQREVLSQQSLTKEHGKDVAVGKKDKLLAVLGVQVSFTSSCRIYCWLSSDIALIRNMYVQTGFQKADAPQAYNYRMRRDALRATWFPESQNAADLYVSFPGFACLISLWPCMYHVVSADTSD